MELNLFKVGYMQVQTDSFGQEWGGGGGSDVYYLPVDDGGGGGGGGGGGDLTPIDYVPILPPPPQLDYNPPVYDSWDPFVDTTPISVDPLPSPPQVDTQNAVLPPLKDLVAASLNTTTQTALTSMESAGYFIASGNKQIAMHWQWYNVKTGEVYAEALAPSFHVWADTDIDNTALRAESPGYWPVKVMAADLKPSNDIKVSKIPYLLYFGAVIAFIAFAKKRKKQVGKVTVQDVYPFMLIGGGFLAFSLIQKILTSLGIWKDKDNRDIDATATDPLSPFNGNLYLKYLAEGVTWTDGIDRYTANVWLNELDNAFSIFGDSEGKAKGILKRCKTQATLSFLAWVYNQNTGGDFLAYLRGENSWYPWAGLSDADINEVYQYIKNQPKY